MVSQVFTRSPLLNRRSFIAPDLSELLMVVICLSSHDPNASSRPWIDSRCTIQAKADARPFTLYSCIAQHRIAVLPVPASNSV